MFVTPDGVLVIRVADSSSAPLPFQLRVNTNEKVRIYLNLGLYAKEHKSWTGTNLGKAKGFVVVANRPKSCVATLAIAGEGADSFFDAETFRLGGTKPGKTVTFYIAPGSSYERTNPTATAWEKAESCPRCHGVPLHDRVTKFVNAMARTWRELNPNGVLFWEPWELSAGETYRCIELLDASCVGLSLHSSIAEVQIAFPADRWFKNVLTKAQDRNMPVIGELWTGSLTEEMEPFTHIATPVTTLRALRAVNNAGKLKGIKEYYGNAPDKEDPNLRMTGLFFANPDIIDDSALKQLAKPYGKISTTVATYWKLASEAVELYPWDVSWLARTIGKVDPVHLLSAATIKGASWQTPAWQSSRRTAFLRTDQTEKPNFWTRENTQLCLE